MNWHTDGKGRLSALIDSAADQHTLASRKSVSELFLRQRHTRQYQRRQTTFQRYCKRQELFRRGKTQDIFYLRKSYKENLKVIGGEW